MRPQEGKDELVDVKNFLVAKAAETPSGTKVNPASPLKADRAVRSPRGRPVAAAHHRGHRHPGSDQRRGGGRPGRPELRAPQQVAFAAPDGAVGQQGAQAPELTRARRASRPPRCRYGHAGRRDRTPSRRPRQRDGVLEADLVRGGGGSSEESAPRTTS